MKKAGIVAFGFGCPDIILSNVYIAIVAREKAWELKAPIYTQKDVCIQSDDLLIKYTEEQVGNPPPTLRIARGAVCWAKNQGIEEIWIVAAEPHLWRCIRDIKYAVKEIGIQISVKVCTAIHEFPTGWFCPDSKQKHTRSRKEWEKREKILQKMPMFLYKIICR